MAAFGSGTALWRIDVVLRCDGCTQEQADHIVERLTAAGAAHAATPDEAVFPDVRATYSFDLEPPEGSVGASFWVRADTLGEATQVGYDAMLTAAIEVTGRALPLWDVRVVPREAISTREDYEAGPAASRINDSTSG